jgi:hypothetical protein
LIKIGLYSTRAVAYNHVMSRRTLAGLAWAAAFAALVLAGSGTARPSAIPLRGTVWVKPFDLSTHCGATSVSARLLRVRCVQFGTYVGKPQRAGASYGWTWDLPVDSAGHTTGPATEHATLILSFKDGGQLHLSLAGKQTVVGHPTATKATAVTNGTWKVTKGTARFVGTHGTGGYTFRTGRTNSESLFSVARVELSGSLTS